MIDAVVVKLLSALKDIAVAAWKIEFRVIVLLEQTFSVFLIFYSFIENSNGSFYRNTIDIKRTIAAK